MAKIPLSRPYNFISSGNAEKHVCKEYVPLQQICIFENFQYKICTDLAK